MAVKTETNPELEDYKSTADAIYALLLRGENLLASDELVRVTMGDMEIVPDNTEAGTGFYEKKFIK